MKHCNQCGTDNPDANNFCLGCGAELPKSGNYTIHDSYDHVHQSHGCADESRATYYRTFKSAFYTCVKEKYARFSGRATRSEFWFYSLSIYLIMFGIAFIGFTMASMFNSSFLRMLTTIVYGLFTLAMFVPNLAVSVRRLHDVGRSGWWVLLGIIPYLGIFILLIFFVLDSQPCDNRFGLAPHETR